MSCIFLHAIVAVIVSVWVCIVGHVCFAIITAGTSPVHGIFRPSRLLPVLFTSNARAVGIAVIVSELIGGLAVKIWYHLVAWYQSLLLNLPCAIFPKPALTDVVTTQWEANSIVSIQQLPFKEHGAAIQFCLQPKGHLGMRTSMTQHTHTYNAVLSTDKHCTVCTKRIECFQKSGVIVFQHKLPYWKQTTYQPKSNPWHHPDSCRPWRKEQNARTFAIQLYIHSMVAGRGLVGLDQ